MADSNQMPASLKAAFENTKVTYSQLGASGLRVSVPILGKLSYRKPTNYLSPIA
jgi:hypothetical protein